MSQMSDRSDKDVEEAVTRAMVQRQNSVKFQKQKSVEAAKKKDESKKDDKDKDKKDDVEPAAFWEIFKVNKPEWPVMAVGTVFSAMVGAFPLVFAIILSEILGVFLESDNDKIMKEATFWSLMFLVLGVADMISLFFSSYLFAIAGERLVTRLRIRSFAAILRQDQAYFDAPENTTGQITAKLASDASLVQ